MDNNLQNRIATFDFPDVELNRWGLVTVGSALDIFALLIEQFNSNPPSGFLLVMQPEGPIPSGVYRENSTWFYDAENNDGVLTRYGYKVRPITDLQGTSGSQIYDAALLNLLDEIIDLFADTVDMTVSYKDFGYFAESYRTVGIVSPGGSALDIAVGEGRHGDTGQTSVAGNNLLPWILGGLGYAVAGIVGAPAGFAIGQHLSSPRKPQPSPVN